MFLRVIYADFGDPKFIQMWRERGADEEILHSLIHHSDECEAVYVYRYGIIYLNASEARSWGPIYFFYILFHEFLHFLLDKLRLTFAFDFLFDELLEEMNDFLIPLLDDF
ncbi:MAG: hypothetical protein QXS76_00180 [Candidatus Bathyarchaeia archaeon]